MKHGKKLLNIWRRYLSIHPAIISMPLRKIESCAVRSLWRVREFKPRKSFLLIEENTVKTRGNQKLEWKNLGYHREYVENGNSITADQCRVGRQE